MQRSPVAHPSASAINRRGPAALRLDVAVGEADERWHDLVSQIGAEVAAPLTAALERIHALGTGGSIDQLNLRHLREEVAQARLVGMIGQQLTRLASGRLCQSHERMNLSEVLRGILQHRHRETQTRGIGLDATFQPAEVIVDASLLFSLLNTCLDWALANAQSQIRLAIDIKPWPAHARLVCQFAHRPADRLDDQAQVAATSMLNTMTWRLLEQTAWTMGLPLHRQDDLGSSCLTLEFPRTVGDTIDGPGTNTRDDGFAPSANAKPLAGNHVLVVSARRDLRMQVGDALKHMGLLIDYVHSVAAAGDFCRDGLPHAIVVEAALDGELFRALRDEIHDEVPGFVFIEIVEVDRELRAPGQRDGRMARVERDAIALSLSSALMFELTRGT